MRRKLLGIVCCFALSAFTGCAVKDWSESSSDGRTGSASAASSGQTPQNRQAAQARPGPQDHPAAPPGMRLGAGYTSALNEPCYEIFPQDGSLAQPLALCRGKDGWNVSPGIFLTVPAGGGMPPVSDSSGAVPVSRTEGGM